MKNKFFEIDFNKDTGTVSSIKHTGDNMNWCANYGEWGRIHNPNQVRSSVFKDQRLISFCESDEACTAVFSNEALAVTVHRFFDKAGNFCERYIFKNIRSYDYFSEEGALGIELPFADSYSSAEECISSRCNTHIWCGLECYYINALKMGSSDINLGLAAVRGSISSYSIEDCKSNVRGRFILNLEHIHLLPDEKYVVEWRLFWHSGTDDFYKKLSCFDKYIEITAKHHSVFNNESIEFDIKAENVEVFFENKRVPVTKTAQGCAVSFKPSRLGEHRFDITANGVKTYTEFFVSEPLDTVIEKRIDYIIDNQQYNNAKSSLDGAFLIFDTKQNTFVFDGGMGDRNACRERIGMALLIAKRLQTHKSTKLKTALDKYVTFLKREFYDKTTGEVFNTIGRDKSQLRLYNAPWVVTLFVELYRLTGERDNLENAMRILDNYYVNGGDKFYPNGFSLYNTLTAFENAGMYSECERAFDYFKIHVDNMVKNGELYPKHEVNFEQTIVTPAATFISEFARYTKNQKYTDAAKLHIDILERFAAHQPSFHLKEIPIRYWDGFWFGKARLFGDTFPHYWSCLSARSFMDYYEATGDERYYKKAAECMRNCLCLFNEKGEGSCAYIYPFTSNGRHGQFYDDWANDQDFALYFAIEMEI